MTRAGLVVNPWESGIDAIVTLVCKVVSATLDEIRSSIETPPDSKLGDVSSTIAFSLAKEKRVNPAQIAKEIVQDLSRHIEDELLVETVEAKGPYINFRFNRGQFAKSTIEAVISQGENYGRSNKFQGLRA